MLVLTRKAEEKIVIGKGPNKIVITILRIQGDKVSVGIEADKETPIYRDELLTKGSKRTSRKDFGEATEEFASELASSQPAHDAGDVNKDAWA